jgi:hypothetical protein
LFVFIFFSFDLSGVNKETRRDLSGVNKETRRDLSGESTSDSTKNVGI